MPHSAHLCVSRDCQFHLATYLGNGYIVSTVGEYFPDSQVREIIAKSKKITLEGQGDDRQYDFLKKIGFVEIGCNRLYETMVFHAVKDKENFCCPYKMAEGSEIDMMPYNTAGGAYKGHLAMCKKWSKKRK
jgi:hypothetical protein